MGNLLDTPVLKPIVKNYIYDNISLSFMGIQGYRNTMEDYFSIYKDNKYLYAGVYDGHGGIYVASYISNYFLKYLSNCINKMKIQNNKINNKQLYDCFISFDNNIKKNIIFSKYQGSTAVCVAISKYKTLIFNCGDSRAIVYNGKEVIYNTTDFKPSDDVEKERILKSGRRIVNDRIDGQINISRCFGDFSFKTSFDYINNSIIAIPEYKILDTNLCKFIVLLTDGITNTLDNETICSYVEFNLQINTSVTEIIDDIIKYCIYKQSTDNMTMCIITLYKYNFNNTFNDENKYDLNIIKLRVLSELNENKHIYTPYNFNNLLKLIKKIDYNLRFSAGFKYNYINNIYIKSL